MIRPILFTLLLISPSAAPSPARATPSVGARVTSTSHGLQLTLTIPKRIYPRYALAIVQGTVINVSGHTLWLRGNNNSFPGISNPEPQVLSGTGKIVYPPAFPYLYPLPGPFIPPQPLSAGKSISGSYYVIIRDARIRLAVEYTTRNPRQGIGPMSTVYTSSLVLHLTPANRPLITTHLPPDRLSAAVQRPPGVRGKLLRVEYSDCPDTTDNWTIITWVRGATTLEPDCGEPQSWHVIAGWVGFSVVRVDYAAPVPPTPTPGPPTATPTPQPTETGPEAAREVVRRAQVAMASVYSVHAVGIHSAHDPTARTNLQIAGDCRSGGVPLSLQLRTHRWGAYSDASRREKIDERYIVIGPASGGAREWLRSPVSGSWKRQKEDIDDIYQATSFGMERTYAAQICPGVIRDTYLNPVSGLSGLHLSGPQLLLGMHVWHVHGRIGPGVDLYIEMGSYRLLRLEVSDGSSYSGWRVQLDYSRYNEPIHIAAPSTAR